MKYPILIFLFCSLYIAGCSGQRTDSHPVKIKRFDTDLYNYLQKTDAQNRWAAVDTSFLNLYGRQVLSIGGTDSIGFYERLERLFSEPTLMKLYHDEQGKFENVEAIESELSSAFGVFFTEFPEIRQPDVYMHVSGLNQNVVVTDDFLSISAEKYLGEDYSLYQDYFYDYQRKQMSPDRIVPDYLLGFLMANFPFKGNEDVLLDRMIYEGKLRYILSRLISERQIWEYVGYSKEQYLWCSNNQSRIWKTILENQHLFDPDYLITSQYLKVAPHTAFLPEESPGGAGVWVGYQIVISYMKNNSNTSLSELMNQVDYLQFLKKAKYKP